MNLPTISEQPRQWAAAPERDDLRLIPPLAEEFFLNGADVTDRARRWALREGYTLAAGVPSCAHGLYLLPRCPENAICRSEFPQLDHARIWVPDPSRAAGSMPFVLAHPYADEVSERTRCYAAAHGLELISGRDDDGWYGGGTLPIRLTVPADWPVWPIYATSLVLLATQPVAWP